MLQNEKKKKKPLSWADFLEQPKLCKERTSDL